ncbi:MAG: efflux RND transporter periplasmic adaptor subunit, partial [Nitrospinae bacterium]|nr:efflux RND transporter periplasmic adaptor subunit [Nitrospinota bacterium]
IRAPFNGSIVKKETEVGQWLEKGDPAVSMIDDSSLKVEVNLPQHNFSAVEIGASAKIFLESHQSTSSYKTFTGRVIEKIPSGNPTSRTFPVRIKIDKPDRSIAAGMLVNVEIYAKKPGQELIFVPKDAVVRTPKDSSVWVVRPDKNKKYVAHKVMVTTGKLEDNLIAISFKKSRIKHGDLVVVQGNERLKPNAIVKIIKRFN